MKLPCPQAECGPNGCPIANLRTIDPEEDNPLTVHDEQQVAVALADQAIETLGIELIKLKTREQREEYLAKLAFENTKTFPDVQQVRRADTFAIIATAFHRHFDEPIKKKPPKKKG